MKIITMCGWTVCGNPMDNFSIALGSGSGNNYVVVTLICGYICSSRKEILLLQMIDTFFLHGFRVCDVCRKRGLQEEA